MTDKTQGNNKKILVVGPSWVGDMIMAQSLFITLKQQNPDVQIDVLAPVWSLPILQRMPEVTDTIEMPVRHGKLAMGARYQLGKQLRQRKYEQAIVTPRSWKSALVPFFAHIPQRTGYRGEMRFGLLNDIRLLDKAVLTKTVQRYVNLGLAKHDVQSLDIPHPVLEVDKQNQKELLGRLSLSLDLPVIGFMPGAEYGPAKCWPPEYFSKLAQRLIEAGHQVWIFGSDKDVKVAEEIASQVAVNGIYNLAGSTRLEDVIDLIALCEKVVTNDSGLMHVAAAVGKNLVAIYGSSTPDYTPPLSDHAEVLYLGLECSPCFKRECPYGHYECLRNITVDNVFSVCSLSANKKGSVNT